MISYYLTGCQTISKENHLPIRINSARYQSWVISENELGTDAILRLNLLQKEIEVDSFMFRGVKLPVFTMKEKGERKPYPIENLV